MEQNTTGPITMVCTRRRFIAAREARQTAPLTMATLPLLRRFGDGAGRSFAPSRARRARRAAAAAFCSTARSRSPSGLSSFPVWSAC
ncbi:hypothetical protein [Kitasatospora sp. NPDC056531]|uniref:hypothetical protein n=1 Tax=Kitasatospora sp. NPDC056531 TaxID=3345856 RepID=UPI0036C8907A